MAKKKSRQIQVVSGTNRLSRTCRSRAACISFGPCATVRGDDKAAQRAVTRNLDRFPDDFAYQLTQQSLRL